MRSFRVWAPAAARVELELEGRRRSMHRGSGGWWSARVELETPEVDYGFLVDGEGPFPDPRAPWQPRGVHGLSRTLDHAAFPWQVGSWRVAAPSETVLYELHVGTFTPAGTFEAAIERLDQLVDLGVTHVELMPVAQFPGARGWGYDGVALFAPHHGYGGPTGLKKLVDACHGRGLGVLLDVVYNHLGPDGNYLGKFGPYFTDRYATPWGQAVNLDGPGSDEVRRFLIDDALAWLRDYRIDGLRLDAVHALLDLSAIHFLEQLAIEAETLSERIERPLWIVAESDLNDPRLIRPRAEGGYGLAAQWNEDFHHALHVALTGERDGYYLDFHGLRHVALACKRAFVHDGRHSPYRRKSHGRPPAGLEAFRFVGYAQNHDQIGNRARGERLAHLVGPERAKVAAALALLSPFVPLLFQGEEWAASAPFQYFTDHQDPELAEAVRAGRRSEFAAFGWNPEEVPDPQDEATFLRSKLDWSEREREPHGEVLAWHRRLLRLRRDHGALREPSLERVRARWSEAEGWIAIERGPLTIAANLAPERRLVPVRGAAGGRLLAVSRPGVEPGPRGLRLPPDSAAVHARP